MIGASSPVQNTPKNLLEWVRKYSESLFQLARKSPIPAGFQFPVEQAQALLEKNFHSQLGAISIHAPEWKEKTNVFTEINSPLYTQNLSLGHFNGHLIFSLPKPLLTALFCSSLNIEQEIFHQQDQKFQDDAHTVIGAHLLSLLTEIPEIKALDINRFDGLMDESTYLAYDITTHIQDTPYIVRISLSHNLVLSWKQAEHLSKDISPLQSAEVPLIFEAGQIQTSVGELSTVALGDFIQIDLPYFSKNSEKLRCVVTLEGKPIFHVRIKEGSVKIVETPLQYQEQINMADEVEKLTDEDLAALNTENGDSDNDNQQDIEDELTLDEANTKQVISAPKTQPTTEAQETSSSAITPKDIPITLTIELARMKMSADQLLELKPGSVMDVEIHPERGVVLSISGKVVGKGELLQVGNVLGVRVTQLCSGS